MNIISKIQNLLELAYDTPDDAEGQAALLMAQKLMVKHNISLSEVRSKNENNTIGETVATWEHRMPWWKENLAVILGRNFRCEVMRKRLRPEGVTQVIFFGYDSDTELCTKVYEGALLYLEYRLKRLFSTIAKKRWIDYKKSYLLGFLEGLSQRFEAQSQSSEEFALMVQVPAEVLEAKRNQLGKVKNRPVKNPQLEIDFEGYQEGFNHAKNTKLMSEELVS